MAVCAAFTISKDNLHAGDTQTFTITDWKDAKKVQMRIVCGTFQTTLTARTSGNSFSWTSTYDLMNYFPYSYGADIFYYLDCWDSSNTKIGTQIVKGWASVSSDSSQYLPVLTASEVTISEGAAGFPSAFSGVYVQGLSRLQIVTAAITKHNATVRSVDVVVFYGDQSMTYSGENVKTDAIPWSGTVGVRIKVTDTRGCTAVLTQYVTVVTYFRPQITSCAAYRCLSATDWTPAGGDSNYICVAPRGSVAPVNNLNSIVCKVFYRIVGQDQYTSVNVTTYTYSLTDDEAYIIFAAPSSNSYDIYCQLIDAYTNTIYYTGGVAASWCPLVIDPQHDAWGWGGAPSIWRGHDFKTPVYLRDDSYVNDGVGNLYQLNQLYDYLHDIGWLDFNLISPAAAISYVGAKYRKIGKMVFVNVGVTGITQDFQKICQLPSGYCPAYEINVCARYYNLPDAQVTINSSGEVYAMMCRVPWASTAELRFSVCFLVD